MSQPVSTVDNPVKFFKEYFLEGGYEEAKNKFRSYCIKEELKSPSNVIYTDVYGEISIVIGKVDGHFDDFAWSQNSQLMREVENSKKIMLDALVKNFSQRDKFVETQKFILEEIFTMKSDIFEEYPSFKETLDSLANHLAGLLQAKPSNVGNDVTKVIINQHKSRTEDFNENKSYNEEDLIKYSLFAGDDVKIGILKWIHSKLCEHRIIEELEDTEEGERQFIEIFASHKPETLGFSIKFKKKNTEAVIIFNKLHEYFTNFTPQNIEKSGCFITKSGKPFSANQVNVTNSNIRKKSLQGDVDVRYFIDEWEQQLSSRSKNKKS